MNVHPIHTKSDYRIAMQRINVVWHAKSKSLDAEELKVLSRRVEEYGKKHFTMPKVDPVSMLLHVMEVRQLSRKDLEPA